MKLESYNGPIGYQTIYRLVRKNQWSCLLLCKGKSYRKRHGDEAEPRFIPGCMDIDERQDCVDLKKRSASGRGIRFTAKMDVL
ncbi:MAG: hypothetical protein QS748_14800 [Candidatus Endonucleobacter bathymodioli]|uniref:Uncharacterized protein n=1 Tax=Candidatus Endonucleibacter bathymodioli TaxID=539814 RepID=A0AA90P3H2_9GAMM|nr:hypothetical protein [Candidatus Endonucleobacter bathymodioli]